MDELMATAILIATTLASFALALLLARLGLAVMFRMLPGAGPRPRIIPSGRAIVGPVGARL